jgi:dienelactone hydrolase
MRKTVSFLIFAIITAVSFGQGTTPEAYGLKPYAIQNDTLGTINFYVSQKNIDKEKPLLVFLDGSGFFPLYTVLQKPDGSSQVIGTVHSGFYRLAEQFHFVVISKPGILFSDSLQAESFDAFAQHYKPSKEYNELLSLEWRVHSASLVIDYLNEKLPIKNKQIVTVGYSEGGQVVPKLALTNKKITKIVNIVGGGLNQFYDFITAARLKAQKGIITQVQAQQDIDSLTTVFKDIYAHPTATDKFWYGHTYKRWASFCSDVPLHNMLQLNIPILMIAAGHDENSPITGMDYVPLEFARNQKQNLTYKVYPDSDHWFNDQELNENRFTEMITFVTNWLIE